MQKKLQDQAQTTKKWMSRLKNSTQATVILMGLGIAPFSTAAVSNDRAVMDFFEKFQHLNKVYDPAIKDLYSDDAVVSVISYGKGIEVLTKIQASKFKPQFDESMKYAKALSSSDRYSNIRISPVTQGYKIEAHRYSFDKCYEDKAFSLELRKNTDNSLQIVKQYESTVEVSACTESLKQDVPAKLQAAAALQSKELPMKINREFLLEKVYAEGMSLTYQFRVFDYNAAEMDQLKLNMYIEPMMIDHVCSTSSLVGELKNGVIINQKVYSKDDQLLVSIKIDQEKCSQQVKN